jgi:hypothetical protein
MKRREYKLMQLLWLLQARLNYAYQPIKFVDYIGLHINLLYNKTNKLLHVYLPRS